MCCSSHIKTVLGRRNRDDLLDELSFVIPAVGGIMPFSKASVTLIKVAMLLAASL